MEPTSSPRLRSTIRWTEHKPESRWEICRKAPKPRRTHAPRLLKLVELGALADELGITVDGPANVKSSWPKSSTSLMDLAGR